MYLFLLFQNLNVDKIPDDAFSIPPPPNGPEPGEPIQGGHHMMMQHQSESRTRKLHY